MRKLTNFVERASEIHNGRYDYSNTQYINMNTKISIICKVHGEFFQSPNNHLKGQGCPTCGKIKQKHTMIERYGCEHPFQSDTIRTKFKQTMLERYDADCTSHSLVLLEKMKANLVNKYGVDNVRKSQYVKDKIKETTMQRYGVDNIAQCHMQRVVGMLNNADWLYMQHHDLKKSIKTIADELGVSHSGVWLYFRKHAVAIRYTRGYSDMCIDWLNSFGLDIQHAKNIGEYTIPGTRIRVDGFYADTNTVYEFHGDCFHGNPTVFKPNDLCHPWSNLTAGELYRKTVQRENKIRELGYNLIIIWEHDWIATQPHIDNDMLTQIYRTLKA